MTSSSQSPNSSKFQISTSERSFPAASKQSLATKLLKAHLAELSRVFTMVLIIISSISRKCWTIFRPFCLQNFGFFAFNQNNVNISLNYISSKTLSTVLGISQDYFQTRSSNINPRIREIIDRYSKNQFNNFAAHSQHLC